MKMSNNPAKYEVLFKQYLHSILDKSFWFWFYGTQFKTALLQYFNETIYFNCTFLQLGFNLPVGQKLDAEN